MANHRSKKKDRDDRSLGVAWKIVVSPLVNVQLTRDEVLAVRYHRPCWPALMKPDEKARLMPINISVGRYKRGPLVWAGGGFEESTLRG